MQVETYHTNNSLNWCNSLFNLLLQLKLNTTKLKTTNYTNLTNYAS